MRNLASPKQANGRTRRTVFGILLILVLSLVSVGTVLAAESQVQQQYQTSVGKRAIVRGGGADLRETPGGNIVKTLKLGTAITAIARTPDDAWIKVMDDETSAWVHVSEIVLFGRSQLPILDVEVLPIAELDAKIPKPTAAAVSTTTVEPTTTVEVSTEGEDVSQTATVTTAARGLNIRKGTGTNTSVVGTLAKGATVKALARNDESSWIQIQMPGGKNIGWVSAAFVDMSGDPADLPVSDQLSEAKAVRRASTSTGGSGGGNAGLKGKLAYQEKSGGKINVYDLATGSLRNLTSGMDPAISPDSKTVAFLRNGGEGHGLYLIDIDGNNERRIYSGSSGLRSPSWSPDGTEIVIARTIGYSTCRDVGYGFCFPDNPQLQGFPLKHITKKGLSVMDTNGGNFRDIPALESASAPNWNEGGITYESDAGIEITGTDYETYAVAREHRFSDPNWQPGRGRIVFHSLEKDHREIFLINPDGNGLTALTRPPTTLVKEWVQNVAPAWSPDGKHIIFLSTRDGDWAFYVMNADGSNQRKLNINAPVEYNYQSEQVVSWGI
ncbi:MAG: SH3 domain-containing protein [Chloroflexi bacterium]|nr:SH3 domain-containing protein [Chloroflexota bacterium]